MRPSCRPVVRSVVVVALSTLCWSLLPGCELAGAPAADESLDEAQDSLSTSEGFESGSKSSYAAADVTLGSGTWNLDEALIGSLAGDAKNGTSSVRVRGSGRLTMQFDRSGGAGTVSVKYATYGSDGNGTFALYWSQNGGSSWTQAGSPVTTSSTLSSASFTINRSGTIRFQFRKTDGSSDRINLDDVVITDYAGTPAPDAGTAPDAATTPPPSTPPGAGVSVHTTLGLPSAATTSNWNNYLSVKAQYVVAYNAARKVPNWVSWELNSSYLGSAARQNNYRTDSTLPAGMPQASLADYSGSGWDRGHMCPSGDRTLTTTANGQTFYLSNMLPQAGNNNSGPWEKLETYSRTLASSGKELFIISGGVYSSSSRKIGASVSVPDSTWKVVVVLNKVGDGPAQVTSSTRVIAVLMPNDDSRISASDSWQSYRVSVDSIESLTGMNFLSDVSTSVQNVVEARVDNL